MGFINAIKRNAFWRDIENLGYNYSERKTLWTSKACGWNWIAISYGLRNSEKPQRFPVWNMSNNCERSLMFGAGFWFFQITYHRRGSFNQGRKYPFRKKLWNFYQLIC